MIKVILILMPVVILINCLPLVAALSYDKDYQNYACVVPLQRGVRGRGLTACPCH